MHYVGRVEDQPFEPPAELGGHHRGLTRARLIGPAQGSVHTDLAVSQLNPGGSVETHIHSFELAAYVLAGSPALLLNGQPWRLRPGDFALMPIGVAHAWANPGEGDARWLTISTPLRQEPGSGRRDTFAVDAAGWSPETAPPIHPRLPTS